MEKKGSKREAAVYGGKEERYEIQDVAANRGPLKPRVSTGILLSSDADNF